MLANFSFQVLSEVLGIGVRKNATNTNLIFGCHRNQNHKLNRHFSCNTRRKTQRTSFLMWQRKNDLHVNNKIPALQWDNCRIWIWNWRAMQSKLNIAWIEYNFVDLLWQILPSNIFSQAKFHISTTGAFSFLWILFITYGWSSHLALCFNHWALHSLLRWLKHYTALNPSFIGLLGFISFGWDFLLWKLIA